MLRAYIVSSYVDLLDTAGNERHREKLNCVGLVSSMPSNSPAEIAS